jgi:hypothetical protein
MPNTQTIDEAAAVKKATLGRLADVLHEVVDAHLLAPREYLGTLTNMIEGDGIAGQRVLTGIALSLLVDGRQSKVGRYLMFMEDLYPDLYAESIMAFAIAGAMLWEVHQRQELREAVPGLVYEGEW